MSLAHAFRLLARRAGIELHWYEPAQSQEARLFRLLSHHCVDTVLDVGANDGGYARMLRDGGFEGGILSFEPLDAAHRALDAAAARDAHWHVAPRMALGAHDGEVEINVAGNSTSSSILPMMATHSNVAPQSAYVDVERVPIHRLDGVRHAVIEQGSAFFLKIDTQGYEMPVLLGAERLLHRVRGVQLELSLTPLYDGQTLYRETIDWLVARGFELWNVIPGFSDSSSGRMLQMDGVFFQSLQAR